MDVLEILGGECYEGVEVLGVKVNSAFTLFFGGG